MPYRTPLESRIAKKTTRAVLDYRMVEDGDRVMVGLSGGKDSWALLEMLHVLRQRAPIRFSIIAINVDSGYKEYKHDLIRSTCEARGWDLRIEHTSIGEVMDDLLDADATPCSLCARLRRGVLYRIATEVGATKIALGHHADDFIETLLINVFFAGAIKAMPARLVSDDGRHVVVRPFVYVSEDEARQYTREVGLPVIGCCCPACGDLSLQRQRIKRLLMQLERDNPGVKASLLKALGNVMPRHLLDKRLAALGESARTEPADDSMALPGEADANARDRAAGTAARPAGTTGSGSGAPGPGAGTLSPASSGDAAGARIIPLIARFASPVSDRRADSPRSSPAAE